MLAEYGLLDLMGSRSPNAPMLGAVLDLFSGHPVPALRRGEAWFPASATSRRIAFSAHLLGVTYAGSYPFLGVVAGACNCPRTGHTCDGLGTTYLCIDLDDHNGEGGMDKLVAGTTWECRARGFDPVVFTSKSATGAHVYVFFDSAVPTREAHALGVEIAHAAGAAGRADVMPSAGHPSGYGTTHALPLHPRAGKIGGGVLLDERQRPVAREDEVVGRLREAHLARGTFRPARGLSARRTAPRSSRERIAFRDFRDSSVGRQAGAEIVREMRRLHPQFRRALAVSGDQWKGGKSARDAHLAAMMVRQGVRPTAAAYALTTLPGTKAAQRGVGYALAVVQHAIDSAVSAPASQTVPLAGTPRRNLRRSTPWRDRVAPPLDYDGERNPWWEPQVQARFQGRTGRVDKVVLAYLIDRWYRGPFPRRQFFAGQREIGDALGLPPSTVGAVVRRIATRYPDVLRVTAGVPHRTLRLATAYDVVGARSHNRVAWRDDVPGQSGRDTVCSSQVEREEAPEDVHSGDGDQAREGLVGRDLGARPEDRPTVNRLSAEARA